ncbi:hypothetical protein GCM10022247_35780 [Allokutzneria multivorans]|uniref:Uncharacterized protein n=1 Tax=Allokutzneria multivorans TaxID=1142134 RepID=A0ABP7SDV1_9PSEU
MNRSRSAQLLHVDLEVGCPECTYPIWMHWAEIVAETTIRCPCCRTLVRMVDQDGRAQTLGADLESQFDQAMKGLFR